MIKKSDKVIIIGAGATGLSAAYLLSKMGIQTDIIECNSKAGGLLSTFDIGENLFLECFYHHFFTHDVELKWLLQELDLSNHILFTKGTMGIFRNSSLYPFNSPLDIMKFCPIGMSARIRFMISSALLSLMHNPEKHEDISVLEWLHKYSGPDVVANIWEPLLKIKFGEAASTIPVAWMAGRFRQRLLSRKRGQEQLGYLIGSMKILVDKLCASLSENNCQIHLNEKVTSLIMRGGLTIGVQTEHGTFHADHVISTVPSPVLADIVKPTSDTYSQQLHSIKYSGAICGVFLLKNKLSNIYWTNVADPGYEFGGVIEHTNLVAPKRYNNQHIVYLSRYLPAESELFRQTDNSLRKLQTDQLNQMLSIDIGKTIKQHWIFRTPFAAPLVNQSFSKQISPYKTPINNLYAVNMTHIYPDERSANNSIRSAAELLRAMGAHEIANMVPAGISLAGKI